MKESHEQKSKRMVTAGFATLLFHLFLVALCAYTGLRYLDPPPKEKSLLVEFEPEAGPLELKSVEAIAGVEPRAPEADPDRDVELVQKSEGQHTGKTLNEAQEATVGDNGDVEVKEPERKPEINRRALFSADNNRQKKDTVAAQVADKAGDALKEGHAEGNTQSGRTDGEPSVKLQGRQILGSLPKPAYDENAAGKVVVNITVDAKGNVTSATINPVGTTTNNSVLRESARKAAMKAKFSTGSDVAQSGTITYIFTLK